MQVTVRLFATYREIAGSRELKVRLPGGSTVRSLLDSLYATHPRLKGFEDTMLLAVNHEFAEPTAELREGDEVALMPPVSGGAGGFVEVQRKAIDVEVVVASVHRHDAGAVVLFLGTVRSDPGVRALDYEVYRPMALHTMAAIVARAKKEFGVLEMTIVHRLGRVPVGRPSVAIACSTAHRREAFNACSWAMDEVKKVVPIWKAES
jgi:MoaE-MoaD fusion protein